MEQDIIIIENLKEEIKLLAKKRSMFAYWKLYHQSKADKMQTAIESVERQISSIQRRLEVHTNALQEKT